MLLLLLMLPLVLPLALIIARDGEQLIACLAQLHHDLMIALFAFKFLGSVDLTVAFTLRAQLKHLVA